MTNGNLLFTLSLFVVCSAILVYSFKSALAPIVSTATYRLQALIDPSLHDGRIILNDDDNDDNDENYDDESHEEAGLRNGGFANDGNRYRYGDTINTHSPIVSSSTFHTPDLERFPLDRSSD